MLSLSSHLLWWINSTDLYCFCACYCRYYVSRTTEKPPKHHLYLQVSQRALLFRPPPVLKLTPISVSSTSLSLKAVHVGRVLSFLTVGTLCVVHVHASGAVAPRCLPAIHIFPACEHWYCSWQCVWQPPLHGFILFMIWRIKNTIQWCIVTFVVYSPIISPQESPWLS